MGRKQKWGQMPIKTISLWNNIIVSVQALCKATKIACPRPEIDGGMHHRFPFVIWLYAHFHLASGFKQTELMFRQTQMRTKGISSQVRWGGLVCLTAINITPKVWYTCLLKIIND